MTSKLIIPVVALFAVALASATLTLWSVHQSERGLLRVDYAHKVYEAYLELSSDATRLLWKIEHGPGGNDAAGGSGRPSVEEALRANVAKIRAIVDKEIELFGEEEVDELIVLARIERIVEDLLREYREASATAARNQTRVRSWQFDEELERALHTSTTEIIASEMEEVRETLEQTRRSARNDRGLAILFAALAVLAALFALYRLHRDVREPLERLLASAAAIERGDPAHRAEVNGSLEVRELANAFNRLADQIASRESALCDARTALEAVEGARAQETSISMRWPFLRPSIKRAGA